MINEAQKIEGFDPETQHAFDKLAAYYAVFKSRANPSSKRYITKLNQFLLQFMQFLDKSETGKGQMQIKTFINDIHRLQAAGGAPEAGSAEVVAGGSVNELPPAGEGKHYVNPNNGGEYYDGDVHVYEAPADEEVKGALAKLRAKGYKVTR